jgi:UV DNA damage endonuclease
MRGVIMAIGYACIQLGSENTKLSSLFIKNYNEEKLIDVINNNLNALEQIIKYNIDNEIKLFRISSDIIPLASHPINSLPWWDIFKERLASIGKLIKDNEIRVTMHPGQYTVINSINEDVVKKSFEDLEYHLKFLNSLNCDNTSKMVLHIGGVYSDKKASMERFIINFNKLDDQIKNRLIIENDDKSYNIEEVLYISEKINIPVVFDNLHHKLNPPENWNLDQFEIIEKCNKTWKKKDGKQKIHYSQSANNLKNGAHSKYINAKEFMAFYNKLLNKDIDIMLEVKDKNLSAIKCNLLTSQHLKISKVEKEWARYKYFVLSCSVNTYNEIRQLLKDKENIDLLKFYTLIENSLNTELNKKAQINALQHIWGYFKKKASDKEKQKFLKLLDGYINKDKTLNPSRNYLYKLSLKYNVEYLLDSLYFYI